MCFVTPSNYFHHLITFTPTNLTPHPTHLPHTHPHCHSCALATCLFPHRAYPTLNTPLVAWSFIAQLGLPYEVWTLFTQITQLLRASATVPGLETTGQHHPEQVWRCVFLPYNYLSTISLPSWRCVIGDGDGGVGSAPVLTYL